MWRIQATTTGGHDPRANGMAERYVGLVKQQALSYLSHKSMSLEWWYWASLQASVCLRMKAMKKKIARGAPTFGDQVLIRDPAAEKKSFQEKSREAMFLSWSSVVTSGAWVVCWQGDREIIRIVSLPENWKHKEENRWTMTEDKETEYLIISEMNK